MTDIQPETAFRTQELWRQVQELPVTDAGAKVVAQVVSEPGQVVPEDVRASLLGNPIAQSLVEVNTTGTTSEGGMSQLQLRSGGLDSAQALKHEVATQLRDSFQEQGQLELQRTYFDQAGTNPKRLARIDKRLEFVRSQRSQLKSMDAILAALAKGPADPPGIEVDANAARLGSHGTLNIGSGNQPMKAAINLDVVKGVGVDVIADVRDMPFPDEHFQEVRGQKVPSPLLGMLGNEVAPEIFRVLKPGGTINFHSMTAFGPGMIRPLEAAGFVNIKGAGTHSITAEKPLDA